MLTSLSKLLISQDYEKYIKEMTCRHLDWRNSLGAETYECFRYICTMEKKMLEAARDNGGFSIPQSIPIQYINTGVSSSKNKSKSVFTTLDQSDLESDEDLTTGVQVAAGHSDWIKPGSCHKFSFPLQDHDHEIAACPEFLILTPKDRWNKISKGCICYTCLKPKGINGICKTRRCTEE